MNGVEREEWSGIGRHRVEGVSNCNSWQEKTRTANETEFLLAVYNNFSPRFLPNNDHHFAPVFEPELKISLDSFGQLVQRRNSTCQTDIYTRV